ncbi:hypothetical protein TNCV_863431 [Trichonephila clavipes]|nr:hypothetical protein TNCV_863431 [Trichonephila clavipes]
MYIQDRFGSYRSIEWTKTDWNCTRYSIITCLAQTSDSLARLTQTLARMPDVMDMRERNIKSDISRLLNLTVYHRLYTRSIGKRFDDLVVQEKYQHHIGVRRHMRHMAPDKKENRVNNWEARPPFSPELQTISLNSYSKQTFLKINPSPGFDEAESSLKKGTAVIHQSGERSDVYFGAAQCLCPMMRGCQTGVS